MRRGNARLGCDLVAEAPSGIVRHRGAWPVGIQWVDIAQLPEQRLHPSKLARRLGEQADPCPVYLGDVN